jgi:hypothetical protein
VTRKKHTGRESAAIAVLTDATAASLRLTKAPLATRRRRLLAHQEIERLAPRFVFLQPEHLTRSGAEEADAPWLLQGHDRVHRSQEGLAAADVQGVRVDRP